MKKILVLLAMSATTISCGKKDEDVVTPSTTTPVTTTPTTPGTPTTALTYTNTAKAILDAKCVTCHAVGGIAAYLPLNTYALAAAAKADIVRTSTGATTTMPKSTATQLTADEKTKLKSWVDAGAAN